ncbi:MAG: hypothetical protein DSY55_02530 [Clostridia bacterium]|nr:MAG: hypothetical protein DSY55_02530 [Clostridia bacterium]
MTPVSEENGLHYDLGGVAWQHVPGGRFCGTRGPHGMLPVFTIADFSLARGGLLARGISIVFEEILPGMSLLIFLDSDQNPFGLAQTTDPGAWRISQRKALRTRRRRDAASDQPITLKGVSEITIYTDNISASVPFYRDIVGLPLGLAYFAHVHLAADNAPVVLRTTRWQCKARHQPHGSEPTFAVDDLNALAQRLSRAGFEATRASSCLLTTSDPSGIPLHFVSQRSGCI